MKSTSPGGLCAWLSGLLVLAVQVAAALLVFVQDMVTSRARPNCRRWPSCRRWRSPWALSLASCWRAAGALLARVR